MMDCESCVDVVSNSALAPISSVVHTYLFQLLVYSIVCCELFSGFPKDLKVPLILKAISEAWKVVESL